MTKRQESMEAMSQILQGNPTLWQVAGDLFVRHMDWPGAQEMADRLAKTIDPKLLEDQDESPALQAANQQVQQMEQQMQVLQTMLERVGQSMESQELRIKEYDSETKRISALAAGMQPEQVQELVMQTLRDVLAAGEMQ
jgi:TolA-binding protein